MGLTLEGVTLGRWHEILADHTRVRLGIGLFHIFQPHCLGKWGPCLTAAALNIDQGLTRNPARINGHANPISC